MTDFLITYLDLRGISICHNISYISVTCPIQLVHSNNYMCPIVTLLNNRVSSNYRVNRVNPYGRIRSINLREET